MGIARRPVNSPERWGSASNHAHMVALYALWYNFVRIQKTMRVTPAMAAAIADRLWSMGTWLR
jgi:hypothetical protein